jgi:putative phosphoesterase
MRLVTEKLKADLEYIFHLGDHYSDAMILKEAFPELPFLSVCGNCDFGVKAPKDILTDINGKKIFLTHGHNYGVKSSYEQLIAAAQSRSADICLFGHTHITDVFYSGDILFLNPGSISYSRNVNEPTYGVLDFTADGVVPAIAAVKNGLCVPVKTVNVRR